MTEDISENFPCSHVAMWISAGEVIWNDEALERQYKNSVEEHENEYFDEEEFLQLKGILNKLTYGDAGSHGTSYATFYFKPAGKKRRSRRA